MAAHWVVCMIEERSQDLDGICWDIHLRGSVETELICSFMSSRATVRMVESVSAQVVSDEV